MGGGSRNAWKSLLHCEALGVNWSVPLICCDCGHGCSRWALLFANFALSFLANHPFLVKQVLSDGWVPGQAGFIRHGFGDKSANYMQSWTHLCDCLPTSTHTALIFGTFVHYLPLSWWWRVCRLCVAHKLRPCLSYSRRRDHINSILLCSLDKRGGLVLIVMKKDHVQREQAVAHPSIRVAAPHHTSSMTIAAIFDKMKKFS